MLLILSLVALASGPFLYALLHRNAFGSRALDEFLFVSISGLVIVHIVPDVFELAGWISILFLLLGGALPLVFNLQAATTSPSRWVLLLVGIGLAMHAAMDGIALLPKGLHPEHLPEPHGHDHGLDLGNHLALGVILHRVPIGMAIWWTLRPKLGTGVAVAMLALIGVATCLAYWLGEPMASTMQTRSAACFQAFVAGSLLHIIMISTQSREAALTTESGRSEKTGERLGVLLGLIFIFMVPHAH